MIPELIRNFTPNLFSQWHILYLSTKLVIYWNTENRTRNYIAGMVIWLVLRREGF